MVNQVVVELPVVLEVKHPEGVVAVGLHKIHSVAILVGLVDIGNGVRLAEGVKQVSAKGEHRVVDAQCRKNGQVQVGLLG